MPQPQGLTEVASIKADTMGRSSIGRALAILQQPEGNFTQNDKWGDWTLVSRR
jgi:hypothetical protein